MLDLKGPGSPGPLLFSESENVVSTAIRHYTIGLPIVGLVLVLICTILIYWPGLSGPLVLDDEPNLKPLIDLSLGRIDWLTVVTGNESGHLGRPLSMASFVFNTLTSGFDTWQLKYTNLMFHLLTGMLVLWLAGRLFQQMRSPAPWMAALLVSALWLTAPLQVSTVLYTVQRMTQLSTLFVLAGLVCYTIGRQLESNRPRLAFGLVLSAFTLWTALAMFSKENGALLPLLALAVEIGFFRFGGSDQARRYIKVLFAVFVLAPGFLAAIWLIMNPEFVTRAYQFRDFTMEQRLLTEPRILFSYLRALLLPNGPALGLYHDDYEVSTGLFSPWTTLPAITAWLLVVVPFLVRTTSHVRVPLFGVIFFLVGHALESSIYPLELYFEHRNYLPSIGIYFTLVVLLQAVVRKCHNQMMIAGSLVVLPLLFAVATHQRVLNWQSWDLLVRVNAAQHPDSARIHTELASLEINAGNMDAAAVHLGKVLELAPSSVSGVVVHTYIGACVTGADSNFTDENQSAKYKPSTYAATAINLLANIVESGRCALSTATEATDVIARWMNTPREIPPMPHEWKLRFNLARLLYSTGQQDQAFAEIWRAAIIAPDRLEPDLLAAKYLLQSGRIDDLRKTVASLQERDTGNRPDLSRLVAEYDTIAKSQL